MAGISAATPALGMGLVLALIVMTRTTAALAQDDPPAPAETETELETRPEPPEDGWISRERYVAGGLVGTILGFGIGHMVVGEWTNFGWVYTVTQLVGVGLFIPYVLEGYHVIEVSRRTFEVLNGIGIGILGLSNIIEKIDLWYRPHDRVAPEGARVDEDGRQIIAAGGRGPAELLEVERSLGSVSGMDHTYEEFLEDEDEQEDGTTFAAYMYDHYRFHRGAGIGLATGGLMVAGLASVAFCFAILASDVSYEIPFGIGAVVSGVIGLAAVPVGIVIAVGAHRRMKRLEPLVSERQQARLVPLLTPVPSPGGPGGGVIGLGGTF